MTLEEEKLMNEKFENLKEFFTEKINNLEKIFNIYIKSSEDKNINLQVQISQVHAITNENKVDIIKLQERVDKVEAIKIAENNVKERTEDKGIKKWQFWLALLIPTLFSLSAFIVMLYKLITGKP